MDKEQIEFYDKERKKTNRSFMTKKLLLITDTDNDILLCFMKFSDDTKDMISDSVEVINLEEENNTETSQRIEFEKLNK